MESRIDACTSKKKGKTEVENMSHLYHLSVDGQSMLRYIKNYKKYVYNNMKFRYEISAVICSKTLRTFQGVLVICARIISKNDMATRRHRSKTDCS